MSKFLNLKNNPDIPSYLRKSSIISIHMNTDVTNSAYPYWIFINTSQICYTEKFEDYEIARKRLTELLSELED